MSEDVLYRSADRENGFNKEIFLKALGLVPYNVINMGGNKLEKYGFTGIELETELAEHIDYEKHIRNWSEIKQRAINSISRYIK